MVTVRVIRAHIAETEDRAAEGVTTEDIHRSVRYFGMSHDDVVAAVQRIAATYPDLSW